MSRKLLFEDASVAQYDLAIKTRNRLLKDLEENDFEDIFDSKVINYREFKKHNIIDYLIAKDDVIFFIENKNVKTSSVLANTLMKMNRL
ncbi:hypothetical protein [Staphylococcus aureus]|uniref:hypothetical protein n=1 Tax=Staphylococcus aureus TaxID=1280 RepID=UPI0002CB2B5F|nr:hypothetical protein [Staphylococcus aureus]ENK02169.1 hypothetical protein SYY_02713 [Staphylococcus aureus M0408]